VRHPPGMATHEVSPSHFRPHRSPRDFVPRAFSTRDKALILPASRTRTGSQNETGRTKHAGLLELSVPVMRDSRKERTRNPESPVGDARSAEPGE
jgi:hypothetical protein